MIDLIDFDDFSVIGDTVQLLYSYCTCIFSEWSDYECKLCEMGDMDKDIDLGLGCVKLGLGCVFKQKVGLGCVFINKNWLRFLKINGGWGEWRGGGCKFDIIVFD